MSPGELDPAVVRRHLLALDQALQILRRHQGRGVDILRTDREERWIVERGLQLCSQNALDIATHIAASAGRDVPDYATAIDQLAELGVLPGKFAATRQPNARGSAVRRSSRRRVGPGSSSPDLTATESLRV